VKITFRTVSAPCAVAVCTGLMLSACGGNAAGGGATGFPKHVTVATVWKPSTLDPDRITVPIDIDAVHLIGGTLYNLHTNTQGNSESVPGLAT
jgi:hypothetical protein